MSTLIKIYSSCDKYRLKNMWSGQNKAFQLETKVGLDILVKATNMKLQLWSNTQFYSFNVHLY